MQQRQLRLGDILDDYCPRERRLTNHAVVAMVGADVKQTRCTTCDTEHEYKHAKVPHQRRKQDAPAALYAQVLADAPKKSVPAAPEARTSEDESAMQDPAPLEPVELSADGPVAEGPGGEERLEDGAPADAEVDGPVHRRLIRATLPRTENTPPPSRPIPEFTIRQPAGRSNRFRSRPMRGGQSFQGGRPNGNVAGRGGHAPGRQHHGRKRSK